MISKASFTNCFNTSPALAKAISPKNRSNFLLCIILSNKCTESRLPSNTTNSTKWIAGIEQAIWILLYQNPDNTTPFSQGLLERVEWCLLTIEYLQHASPAQTSASNLRRCGPKPPCSWLDKSPKPSLPFSHGAKNTAFASSLATIGKPFNKSSKATRSMSCFWMLALS